MFRKLKFLISEKLLAVPQGCGQYEARLEDYLQGTPDSELNDHLRLCGNCRAALENSRMGGQLLRDAWEPASTAGFSTESRRSAFVTGVMARIRQEEMRADSPASFWNPLEFLASRLALTAAMALFALSIYMVGIAPRRTPAFPPRVGSELNAADFPQPPGDPDTNDEVLQSLVERNYER